ncbi:phosphotransferase [Demequina lutea]|uniref:Aminoglycoside phosphotransferase domain-containing protein n=1 Tax=Demequina lutea TaxID=431489 RepID=A0A7Y9Z991_9MICO|nr:aminoglycoside phosphotransferase family protein [Demequina lutea]NYI39968.1 hypothetical protein [Demequina lutea]
MNGELPGGNMNAVVRDGDTVLRQAGPWTPTVHRLLNHLARAGVDWVPRPLGIEGDRERLSLVEGEVPLYPLPNWVWADALLEDGARRLRQLHDASVGFDTEGAVWQTPPRLPSEVICHRDFAPHNLAFADGAIVGAIDFDFCSPGPRLWDVAYFATRIVPLTAATPEGAPGMDDARRRVELILRAYASEATWGDVLRVAIVRLYDLAEMSIGKAVELGRPDLLRGAEGYVRDAQFLRDFAGDR